MIFFAFIFEVINENVRIFFRVLSGLIAALALLFLGATIWYFFQLLRDYLTLKVKILNVLIEKIEQRGSRLNYNYLVYTYQNKTYSIAINDCVKNHKDLIVQKHAKLYLTYYAGELLKIEIPEKKFELSMVG